LELVVGRTTRLVKEIGVIPTIQSNLKTSAQDPSIQSNFMVGHVSLGLIKSYRQSR
jgi:hypothetical protein